MIHWTVDEIERWCNRQIRAFDNGSTRSRAEAILSLSRAATAFQKDVQRAMVERDDLLEACRALVGCSAIYNMHTMDLIDRARSTIAKAEGK